MTSVAKWDSLVKFFMVMVSTPKFVPSNPALESSSRSALRRRRTVFLYAEIKMHVFNAWVYMSCKLKRRKIICHQKNKVRPWRKKGIQLTKRE